MEQEIERKWRVRTMPDLTDLKPLQDERYYLFADDTVSLRFQKRGDRYELERMEAIGELTRTQAKLVIGAKEFEALKKVAKGPLVRDSYLIHLADPQITLKVYRGLFAGLMRIEVEFTSVEQAKNFTPPDWFGDEMTESPLSFDSKLVNMDREEFRALLERQ
ncbi:MAG: hypothetical protein HY817_05025 [Candidatus Abawacabacteria bacterium]|nr:hypothetical protein [Candidatus Abawacabacteria bacterium]